MNDEAKNKLMMTFYESSSDPVQLTLISIATAACVSTAFPANCDHATRPGTITNPMRPAAGRSRTPRSAPPPAPPLPRRTGPEAES